MSVSKVLTLKGFDGHVILGALKDTADLSEAEALLEGNPAVQLCLLRDGEFKHFIFEFDDPSKDLYELRWSNPSAGPLKPGIATVFIDPDPDPDPDSGYPIPGWKAHDDVSSYKTNFKVYPGGLHTFRALIHRNKCAISFKETPANTNLTIVNVMDPLNYWIDKIKLNTEVTTVKALKDVLLAKQNGAKVMTLGGLRQALDDNNGLHYTLIDGMVFSTAYKSDGMSDFKGNQKTWFATDCAVAVAPARRPGWENTNRQKFDMSKITELDDEKRYLCDYNVGEQGFIIVDWQSGPRQQQGMDWADAGMDIVFDYLGDVL